MNIFVTILVAVLATTATADTNPCPDDSVKCSFNLVETIPEGLTYNESIPTTPTGESVLSLIMAAKETLDIANFYFTLKGSDVMSNASSEWTRAGEKILAGIIYAAKRGVHVRVTADSGKGSSAVDLQELVHAGVNVRRLNVSRLVGAGILHTKLLIADNSSFYIGSANMDWRSFSQVKEMGVTVKDCPLLAQDADKIFSVYWMLSDPSQGTNINIPDYLDTAINHLNPLSMKLNNNPSKVYIASSPKPFNSDHRTDDIEAVLNIINSAEEFVNIAVMDYYPMFLFTGFKNPTRFWPVIDDALKKAVVERGVKVRILASFWKSTRPQMIVFLRSLQAFATWSKPSDQSDKWQTKKNYVRKGSIQTKLFKVPSNADQASIPYARVNHNKYMVTDKTGYIGTNNWSADYFVSTAGVSFIAEQVNSTCYSENSLRQGLKHTFDRDWNSVYAHSV